MTTELVEPTRFFDRGQEFVAGQTIPIDRVTGDDRVWAEWPTFCVDVGLAVGNTEGNRWIPRLVDWRRDDRFEVFEVEMRGRFTKHIDLLGEVLLSCRRAMTESTIEVRPGVIRVVLNHTELPSLLPLDLALIPEPPDEIYFGTTALGNDLIWDTRDKFHGLIVGESGSGKTEAAALALTQLHLKGWELVILTPTTDDTAFQIFADLGHTVIAGATPDHVAAAREVLEAQRREVTRRETVKAAAGDDLYQGQPSMLFADESGDWLEDRKDDPKGVRDDKAEIRRVVDVRARRGRKIRQHLLVATQEAYVHNFGTPETLRQLSFRLAVTSMDRVFHGVVFQPSGEKIDPNVARLLSNPTTPKGRAIARGYKPTTNHLGIGIQDIPAQVACLPAAERQALLGSESTVLEVVA